MKYRHAKIACAALGITALLTGEASAAVMDAQAEAARKKALEEDFLESRFDAAEQKLRAAIKACGADSCSRTVMVRLYIGLGSVLAGGKKELSDAGDAFVNALTRDPKAEIDPNIVSSEVTFAFDQAKTRLGLGGGAPASKARSSKKEKSEQEKADAAAGEARRNWITLAFSPDVAFVSGDNVCTSEAQASLHTYCVRRSGRRYVGTPTLDNGDQIDSGAVLSTLRVTLGYDRLFGERLTVGARVGFAFKGANGGASFFPIHAEARVAFWPSADPFAGSGVRPFLFLATGVAQIDSGVDVEILEDGAACAAKAPSDTSSPCTKASKDGILEPRKQTVSAYKQAGLVFVAAGAGVQLAPTPSFAFHLALRAGLTFPSVAPVLTPEAGFALGF